MIALLDSEKGLTMTTAILTQYSIDQTNGQTDVNLVSLSRVSIDGR